MTGAKYQGDGDVRTDDEILNMVETVRLAVEEEGATTQQIMRAQALACAAQVYALININANLDLIVKSLMRSEG